MKNASDLFKFFSSEEFEELFEKKFDQVLQQKTSDEELIREIAEHYLVLINVVCRDFGKVRLHRSDCRKISIDGKRYDFDAILTHGNPEQTEHLIAIDALLSDLSSTDRTVLVQIEEAINEKSVKSQTQGG